MDSEKRTASAWRIAFAQELSRVYSANSHVRMILLGGSPSRGLADQYSDIDMVVYWDTIDPAFLTAHPLAEYGGDLRLVMSDPGGTIQMELYYFDTLIFEVGHITLDEWNQLTADVVEKYDPSPYKIKTIDGFLDAVPIYGSELYATLRKDVEVYPHPLAVKIVTMNLGFFWRGCVLNQGVQRNEIVFYHDAFCMTIKRLMAILGGLNHLYFSPLEPRWLAHYLNRMSIKPEDMLQRIQAVFTEEPSQAVAVLESMIEDVVDLVKQHMPEVDMTRFNENNALEVRATLRKPSLRKPVPSE